MNEHSDYNEIQSLVRLLTGGGIWARRLLTGTEWSGASDRGRLAEGMHLAWIHVVSVLLQKRYGRL